MKRWLLVFVVLALPFGAVADPIEISETNQTERGALACSIWVEPAGEDYEWTFVCGEQVDADGNGTIDGRYGIIDRVICREADPRKGSACTSGGEGNHIEVPVAVGEFTIDVQAGTAGLHADTPSCDFDLDWTATTEATSSSSEGLPRVSPGADPPALSVWLDSRHFSSTAREAALTGTACPAAEVSGSPEVGYLVAYEDTDRTRMIKVDPTA